MDRQEREREKEIEIRFRQAFPHVSQPIAIVQEGQWLKRN